MEGLQGTARAMYTGPSALRPLLRVCGATLSCALGAVDALRPQLGPTTQQYRYSIYDTL